MPSRSLIHSISASPWVAGFKAIQCSHAACSRWLTQRHLATRKVGVTMQGRWYCGYSCFASLAETRFRQLSLATFSRPARSLRTPLTLVLINRGHLTHDQAKLAVLEQERTGTEIGDILLRLGYVGEKDLTSARSSQWDCPVLSSSSNPLSCLDIGSIVLPITLLAKYSMVPLHHVPSTNTLLLGFAYGVEYAVLYAIEQMTGCRTKACLVTPSDFQLYKQQLTRQPPPNDLTFETIQAPSKMAHSVCNYGVLLNANEIAIGGCGEYLWARMKTPSGMSNLLFRAA